MRFYCQGGANVNVEVKRGVSRFRSVQTEDRDTEERRQISDTLHLEKRQRFCFTLEMTWGSAASDTFCSQEDSSSELELYFTARTSFFHKVRRSAVRLRHNSSVL